MWDTPAAWLLSAVDIAGKSPNLSVAAGAASETSLSVIRTPLSPALACNDAMSPTDPPFPGSFVQPAPRSPLTTGEAEGCLPFSVVVVWSAGAVTSATFCTVSALSSLIRLLTRRGATAANTAAAPQAMITMILQLKQAWC